MSGTENTPADSSPATRPRRSSIADLFTRRPSADAANTTAPSSTIPRSMGSVPIASALAQAQQRRLSITTLGLSGTNGAAGGTASGVFGGSTTSSTTGSNTGTSAMPIAGARQPTEDNESAVDDSTDAVGSLPPSGPGSPFARRLSFGARAYGEARSASTGSRPGTAGFMSGAGVLGAGPSPPGSVKVKDGFNFSDNLRNRAERLSISAASGGSPPALGALGHARTRSVASGAPSAELAPKVVAAPPPTPAPAKKPDYIQERILKGDFYMD